MFTVEGIDDLTVRSYRLDADQTPGSRQLVGYGMRGLRIAFACGLRDRRLASSECKQCDRNENAQSHEFPRERSFYTSHHWLDWKEGS
jgi:hypothetical protein